MSLPPSSRKRIQLQSQVHISFKKPKPCLTTTTISNLPYEILLIIFSLFSQKEIYFTLSLVCKRWKIICKDVSLWKKIDTTRSIGILEPKITTNVLMRWISVATLLRHLILRNVFRFDLNKVFEKVAQNCPQLHTLEVSGGQGRAAVMCNLIISCPKLSVFQFSHFEFCSRKFFKHLLGNIKENKMRPCYFEGTITFRQFCFLLRLILKCVELYEVDRYAQLLFATRRDHYYYRLKLDYENISKLLNTISNNSGLVLGRLVGTIWNTNNNECYHHLEHTDYYTENFENVL